MRPIRVVRASDCQCRSHNCPGFDPSILRHRGIWGATDEAALNTVQKIIQKIPLLIIRIAVTGWKCSAARDADPAPNCQPHCPRLHRPGQAYLLLTWLLVSRTPLTACSGHALTRVADPNWFNANPETDPDPAFFLIADPDPGSGSRVWWPKIEKNLKLEI